MAAVKGAQSSVRAATLKASEQPLIPFPKAEVLLLYVHAPLAWGGTELAYKHVGLIDCANVCNVFDKGGSCIDRNCRPFNLEAQIPRG